jgi:hypothetical protein
VNALSSYVAEVCEKKGTEFQDGLVQYQARLISPSSDTENSIFEFFKENFHRSFVRAEAELEHRLTGEGYNEIVGDVALGKLYANGSCNSVCFHWFWGDEKYAARQGQGWSPGKVIDPTKNNSARDRECPCLSLS